MQIQPNSTQNQYDLLHSGSHMVYNIGLTEVKGMFSILSINSKVLWRLWHYDSNYG